MSNGCVRSIWKGAGSTYGARYVNISCWCLCHRHSIIGRVTAARGPRLALACHRWELCVVRSGKRGSSPGGPPLSQDASAPSSSLHSLGKGSG